MDVICIGEKGTGPGKDEEAAAEVEAGKDDVDELATEPEDAEEDTDEIDEDDAEEVEADEDGVEEGVLAGASMCWDCVNENSTRLIIASGSAKRSEAYERSFSNNVRVVAR